MKLSKLKTILDKIPGDPDIFLSSDPSGNSFHSLDNVDTESIMIEGEVYSLTWTADDSGFKEHEWRMLKESEPRVIVLWP